MALFVTFEGPDGSGKTTQIRLLNQTLLQMGLLVQMTREPGGTHIGSEIRSLLLSPDHEGQINPQTEALLYVAARAQNVHEVIRPALKQDKIVLCDRFGDSTLAYQGYGHGLDVEQLRTIVAFATGGLSPDLTLYIELDANAGLQRKQPHLWDRLENYELAFHQAVRDGYEKLIAEDPGRWVRVDGSKSIDEVQSQIRQIVLTRLGIPAAEIA